MRRWALVPVLVFLVVGWIQGGRDLPRGWASVTLLAPVVLIAWYLLRPAVIGWRLMVGSLAVLALATVAINVRLAVPQGAPTLSACLAFAAMFAVHFGAAAFLLWYARPSRPTHPQALPHAE